MDSSIAICDSCKEVSLPAILYKYRKFNELNLRILTEDIVFFAAPNDFDDKKDCRPPELPPNSKVISMRYNRLAKEIHPEMNRTERRNLARRNAKKSLARCPDQLGRLLEYYYSRYCEGHGIFSVTANPYNEDMWKNYADDHKGFCIGFDSEMLASVSSGGGYVSYYDALPPIKIGIDDTRTEISKRIFNKETKWSYEQEYRFFRCWSPDDVKSGKVEREIALPKGCIVAVICGKNMPAEDIACLQEILSKYQPHSRLEIEH